MDEKQRRIAAIQMFLQGIKPTWITRELDRSRVCFYEWLRRYQQNQTGNRYEEESLRLKVIRNSVTAEMERIILQVRDRLEKTLYSQIGTISIQWELKKLKIGPPPIWQINRILKKGDWFLFRKKVPTKRCNEYPNPFLNTQQMDLERPWFIKGSKRFHCPKIIDTETHSVRIHPMGATGADDVIKGIILFWKRYGMQGFLRMDNELSFYGIHRYPRSFSKL